MFVPEYVMLEKRIKRLNSKQDYMSEERGEVRFLIA